MDADTPATAPAKPPAARRGRPPVETPAARIERLQRELEDAQTALAAEADRQALIVGRVVIAKAGKDEAYRRELVKLLRDAVRKSEDRAALASLLEPAP